MISESDQENIGRFLNIVLPFTLATSVQDRARRQPYEAAADPGVSAIAKAQLVQRPRCQSLAGEEIVKVEVSRSAERACRTARRSLRASRYRLRKPRVRAPLCLPRSWTIVKSSKRIDSCNLRFDQITLGMSEIVHRVTPKFTLEDERIAPARSVAGLPVGPNM